MNQHLNFRCTHLQDLCRSEIKARDVGVTREFNGTGELTAVWKKYKTRSIVHLFIHVHLTVHRNIFLCNKTNQMHQFPKFTPA